MKPNFLFAVIGAFLGAIAIAAPASAQMRTGWVTQVEGLAVYQGDATLSGGGDMSAQRSFLRATSLYTNDSGTSVGLSASVGRLGYDFSQIANHPWGAIQDTRISVPVRFRVGDRSSVFLSPQVRWDYESGASASDGMTYGLFAGVAWEVSETLTIGPAFGAYSQLDKSGANFFPAVLVDWDISDRWNLTTGSGIGATQGPGLTLRYAVTDAMNVALTARSEKVQFRLDGTGPAPNGVGEDESIPVVVSLEYEPNPGFSLSVFAGAEFNGTLTLTDAAGVQVDRQTYGAAPIAGLAVRLRF